MDINIYIKPEATNIIIIEQKKIKQQKDFNSCRNNWQNENVSTRRRR